MSTVLGALLAPIEEDMSYMNVCIYYVKLSQIYQKKIHTYILSQSEKQSHIYIHIFVRLDIYTHTRTYIYIQTVTHQRARETEPNS